MTVLKIWSPITKVGATGIWESPGFSINQNIRCDRRPSRWQIVNTGITIASQP